MTQSINTSSQGIFEYIVAVTDPLTLCVRRDTLVVSILEPIAAVVTSTNTSGCGTIDGSIDINLPLGNYDYELIGDVSVPTANADGITNVSYSNLPPGNYSVIMTNTVNGCQATEVVQIEDPPSFNLIISNAGESCDGLVQLDLLNTPANFDYEITYEDGSIVNNGSGMTSFSGLNTGTYSVSVTDLDPPGCTETESIMIASDPEPIFTFNVSQSICGNSGNIFIIDGSGGLNTYTWSGPGLVGSNSGFSVEVNTPGIYEVLATQAGFCDRSEDIMVTINPEHTVNVETNGEPCDGEIVLTANVSNGVGPFSYLWNSGENIDQFSATTSGSYSVAVRDQTTGCEVISTATNIVVEELLEVSIVATPNCSDDGRTVLTAISSLENVTYSWIGPNGPLATSSPTLSTATTGVYTVEVTNENGTCLVSEDFDAIIDPITNDELLLDATANFCSLDVNSSHVNLDPGVFNTYEWTRVPDPTILSTDRILTTTEPGTYQVTLYNGFTCILDRVQVLDDCRPVIYAPTAFTPNEDNLNDTFSVIPNPNIIDFKILIVNKWGEVIFRSDDINFEWDGRLEGTLLPPGTYTYRMRFQSTIDSSVGVQDQYGTVMLIR